VETLVKGSSLAQFELFAARRGLGAPAVGIEEPRASHVRILRSTRPCGTVVDLGPEHDARHDAGTVSQSRTPQLLLRLHGLDQVRKACL